MVIVGLLTGCSANNDTVTNGENNNTIIEENIEEETMEYTVFNALGKSYESSKNIYELNEGDKIYDDMNGYPHVQGEYKEIDFAIDLVSQHLLGSEDVYDFLVSRNENGEVIPLTDNDRAQIEKDLHSLKVDQYGVYEDTPLYFNFMYAQFLGFDDDGVKLYIRGHISGFAVSYIVTVYEQENNLVAKII